jgi:tetratricopeptide (TPR) repeat protein
VTSRVLLRIAGEREYPVDPLPEDDAVTLFLERAASAEPLEAVHEICRRLDGLPLAVELAAARTRLLPPDQLIERLDRTLPLLTGGRRDAPERQRTLRAAIEWSYDLLGPEDQELFRRLAVFAGSFTLDAAEEVCGADLDTLESLVEKSLVRRWESGRLGMLETIREFAAEGLDQSGEAGLLQERLYDYLMAIAPASGEALEPTGVERLGAELANYRSALAWALASHPRRCLELAVTLGNFWVIRGPAEGDRWLTDALSATPDPPLALRAPALLWAGSCRFLAWDYAASMRLTEESLALFRELGDLKGVADALDRLSAVHLACGNRDEARASAEESLAICERLGDRRQTMYALGKVGSIAREEGDSVRAVKTYERVLALAREFGDSWWASNALGVLAFWALEEGEVKRAAEFGREGTKIASDLGDRNLVADFFGLFASIAAAQDEGAAAGRFWGALEVLELEGHRVHPVWRARYEARAHQAEGPQFAAAVERMRALSADEAVDVGLAEID